MHTPLTRLAQNNDIQASVFWVITNKLSKP